MICRHSKDDPSCSSHPDYVDPYKSRDYVDPYVRPSPEPDPDVFEVTDVTQIGPHLILKVKYPNYKNCTRQTYEGNKVLVFLNTSTIDALKWRKIDPHFREKGKSKAANEAPGPDARFPASPEGWEDARAYANMRLQQESMKGKR